MQVDSPDFDAKNVVFSDADFLQGASIGDLRPDLIQRARKLACSRNPSHAWSALSDITLLEHAGLAHLNSESRTHDIAVAAILLLGNDSAIRRFFPDYGIEATAQVRGYTGYENREILLTNLLDSYERLMAFVGRNLPDGGTASNLPDLPASPSTSLSPLSVRDAIFQELISNFLLHRDYTSPVWSILTLQKDRVLLENPCRSGRRGLLDLASMQADAKNLLLSRFFHQLGWTGEPGSGMPKLARWSKFYFGIEILAFDRNIFKVLAPSPVVDDTFKPRTQSVQDLHAPLKRAAFPTSEVGGTVKASDSESLANASKVGFYQKKEAVQVSDTQAMQDERVRKILAFCRTPRNREEIQTHVGLHNRDYFRKEILVPLLQQGLLVATIPDKPNSPKQQYRTPAT